MRREGGHITPYVQYLRRDTRKARVLHVISFCHFAFVVLVESVCVQHDQAKGEDVRMV